MTVRRRRRPVGERGGEAMKLDVRFTAEPTNEARRVRVVRLHPPDGAKGPRLPYLQIGNGEGDLKDTPCSTGGTAWHSRRRHDPLVRVEPEDWAAQRPVNTWSRASLCGFVTTDGRTP